MLTFIFEQEFGSRYGQAREAGLTRAVAAKTTLGASLLSIALSIVIAMLPALVIRLVLKWKPSGIKRAFILTIMIFFLNLLIGASFYPILGFSYTATGAIIAFSGVLTYPILRLGAKDYTSLKLKRGFWSAAEFFVSMAILYWLLTDLASLPIHLLGLSRTAANSTFLFIIFYIIQAAWQSLFLTLLSIKIILSKKQTINQKTMILIIAITPLSFIPMLSLLSFIIPPYLTTQAPRDVESVIANEVVDTDEQLDPHYITKWKT